jgi:hypothetical protein
VQNTDRRAEVLKDLPNANASPACRFQRVNTFCVLHGTGATTKTRGQCPRVFNMHALPGATPKRRGGQIAVFIPFDRLLFRPVNLAKLPIKSPFSSLSPPVPG